MVFSVIHTTEEGSTIWKFRTDKEFRPSAVIPKFKTVEGFKVFLKDISMYGVVELISITDLEL